MVRGGKNSIIHCELVKLPAGVCETQTRRVIATDPQVKEDYLRICG